MRLIFLAFILTTTILSGCVTPGYISGSIYTAFYGEPQNKKEFTIVLPDTLSLQDKQIADLVEKNLIQRGYKKAATREKANIAVLVRYSIGQANTHITSSRDFVFGGKNIESHTSRPRFFQINIIDLEKSKVPHDIASIWQAEIYSEGSSQNMLGLAEHFIGALFENYGVTVKGKSFGKIATF